MIRKLGIALILMSIWTSCAKDEDVSLTLNETVERDERIIQDFFTEHNITDAIADLSGVYIHHIQEGTGENPSENSIVKVIYSMYTLPNNELIDEQSSVWDLEDIISGLQIGIPYIKNGGEADLYIPCRYAYWGTNSSLSTSVIRLNVKLGRFTSTIEEMEDLIIQEYFTENNITDAIKDPSGVYVQHIIEGTGNSPVLSDDITVKYELYNLPEDERVPQTEDPITFNLSGLIYGWQIGIPYMKEGGEAYLYIPRAYAYGDGVLKFKIELIEIVE